MWKRGWRVDLPLLQTMGLEGDALEKMESFNYTEITPSLHRQFCGNSVVCHEEWRVC